MLDSILNSDPYLRTFWLIALPVSLIFIIQSIMTFAGMDGGDGVHADFDGDMSGDQVPFQLLSLRNMINFLLGFSWSGISFYGLIQNKLLLVLVSLTVGCVLVGLFFVIMKQISKLAEDNTFKITDCINKSGSIYIPVPADKSGSGKVQISVKGAVHELEAITCSKEKLETGCPVKVIEIVDNKFLMVEKI